MMVIRTDDDLETADKPASQAAFRQSSRGLLAAQTRIRPALTAPRRVTAR